MTLSDVESVKITRNRIIRVLRLNNVYPDLFGERVSVLGTALSAIVAWPDFCRLISSNNLDDWISSLPSEQALGVGLLLEKQTADFTRDLTLEARMNLARAFLEMHHLQKAVCVLKAVEREYSDNPKFLYLLAWCLNEAGEHASSLTSGLRALSIRPYDPKLQLLVGRVLSKQGDAIKSAEHIALASRYGGDDPYLQYSAGTQLLRAGRYSDGRNALVIAKKVGDEYIAGYAAAALENAGLDATWKNSLLEAN